MACALYSFRLNLDKGTPEEITNWCDQWFKFWVFQHEKGDSGYEHYQGEGSLRKKRRPTEIIGAMTRANSLTPNYMAPIPTEQASGIKNLQHLRERYAAKVDTRISGPYYSTTCDEYMPRQYRGKELTDWQEFAYNIARDECDRLLDRTIHWVYDPTGGHGKSNLASLIELEKKGIDLMVANDYTLLVQSLCDELMSTNNRAPGMLMIDLPRMLPKNQMNGFVSACEQFKKGKVVDGRNHYRKWWFDTPSVWIFSNSLPPMKGLSADRWKVWTFDGPGINATLIQYVYTGEEPSDWDL